MAHADWIIDLGPGAGHDGGRIVFEGTPADLVAGWEGIPSLTGEHLAAYVERESAVKAGAGASRPRSWSTGSAARTSARCSRCR